MKVVVEAPATSANLGPGYDCLGLALDVRDRVVFEKASSSSVTVTGEGAGEVGDGGDNLILRTFRRAFDEAGSTAPEVSVQCTNVIPHGRGLGSSSAAIITGLVAARAMGVTMTYEDVLTLATRIEGHPDNVAPALLGGLTIAWMQDGAGHAARLEPVERLKVTVAVPPERLSTESARGMLPGMVPFADATHAAGRAALAVAAFTANPDLLLQATEDRLHQDYRKQAYPQSWELVQQWRTAGIPAAISGAGPSVIAFAEVTDVPDGWRRLTPEVAAEGVRVSVS